jgi:hypothetical protein
MPKKAGTHPLDLLPGHGALGPAGSLLGVLVHKLATCKHKPQTDRAHQNHTQSRSKEPPKMEREQKRKGWGKEGILTWGLDDPRLVGLGGIAVPLPVGQTLHHLAAAAHAAGG